MSELAVQQLEQEPSATPDVPVVPLADLGPWALLVAALLFVLLYLVAFDGGATSIFAGRYLHEFLHDGRHLLAIPCH